MNKKRLYGIRGAVHTLNKADALQKAAQAVRQAGMCTSAPLFCAQEPHIKGGRTGIIRVLVSAYLENKPVHVYTGGAESLRPDFAR